MTKTNLYDLSTLGRDTGRGEFGKGTVTKVHSGYHLQASSKTGLRFGTYIDHVYVDYETEPDMEFSDTLDVTDQEFKLSENELHLR
jgi:hypothetical protein